MAEREPPQYRLTAGLELVRALDASALSPEVAAWIYDDGREEWRLLLQFKDGQNKRDALLHIAKVLAAKPEIWNGVSMGDIAVVPPDDDAATALKSVVHTGGEIGVIPFGPFYANGVYLSSGLAYRVRDPILIDNAESTTGSSTSV